MTFACPSQPLRYRASLLFVEIVSSPIQQSSTSVKVFCFGGPAINLRLAAKCTPYPSIVPILPAQRATGLVPGENLGHSARSTCGDCTHEFGRHFRYGRRDSNKSMAGSIARSKDGRASCDLYSRHAPKRHVRTDTHTGFLRCGSAPQTHKNNSWQNGRRLLGTAGNPHGA